MNNGRFKLTLKGDEADDSLRLADLIDQLDAVKQVLNQIDKRVSGRKSPGLYYRVTALTMNSPVTIEVEAVGKKPESSYGPQVVDRFSRDVRQVISGQRPADADLELLESYKVLVQPLKRHIAQLVVQVSEDTFEVPKSFDAKVDSILGPDQIERGSIVGSLEVLDIHNDRNLFRIYPVIGPSSVRCHFPRQMFKHAVAGIKHFVKITGDLHFKRAEKFAHFVEVESMEVLPEESDLPKMSLLRGVARGAIGTDSSTEFVDKLRDGDW